MSCGLLRRTDRAAWLALFCAGASASLCPLAVRAELGSVQSVAPPEVPETPDESRIQVRPENKTAVEEPAEVHTSGDVKRPWAYETPAGPTAYVLDARQFEAEAPITRFSQLLSSSASARPLIELRYGLTDGLTLDVGASNHIVQAGFKWNFVNTGDWSLALHPWTGTQFSSDGYNSSTSAPLGAELALSRVFDERHKAHLSLEIARVNFSYFDGYSEYGGSSTASDNTRETAARIAAAYELRLNARHGMTFWLAPAFSSSNEAQSSGGVGYAYSSSNQSTVVQVELGVGYHYYQEHFGASVGVSMGPKWTSSSWSELESSYGNYNDSYNYFNLLSGAVSGGISYRI